MILRTVLRRVVLFLCLSLAGGAIWAQNASPATNTAGDNSKVNQQDRSASEPTADQQQNNRSDLDAAKAIRRSLVSDNSLSTYAHNVKVIAENGKVTLKGPVRSDEEKAAVVAKASQVVGPTNINDEMTVVPKHN